MLNPGAGAVAIDADGKISIETDRHPEPARRVLTSAKLAVGDPLHKFVEFAVYFMLLPERL